MGYCDTGKGVFDWGPKPEVTSVPELPPPLSHQVLQAEFQRLVPSLSKPATFLLPEGLPELPVEMRHEKTEVFWEIFEYTVTLPGHLLLGRRLADLRQPGAGKKLARTVPSIIASQLWLQRPLVDILHTSKLSN